MIVQASVYSSNFNEESMNVDMPPRPTFTIEETISWLKIEPIFPVNESTIKTMDETKGLWNEGCRCHERDTVCATKTNASKTPAVIIVI